MSVDKINGSEEFRKISLENNNNRRGGSNKKHKVFKQNYLKQLNDLKNTNDMSELHKIGINANVHKKAYHGVLLINALSLHRSTIQSLKKLSQQQNDFLKEKNYNQLFDSRDEKENLLENLKKWGNEIRNHYANSASLQEKLTIGEKEKLVTITENISSIVEDVLTLEMENKVLLEKRKGELSDELGTINFYHESLFSVFENKN
jgi:hypothetical protein